jgi:ferredoxin-thioredoxin reductase catalytic subunit
MKPQTHKLNLTTEEANDLIDVLIEHQRGYGTEHTPERIVRIRKVIDQLTNI